MPVCKPARGEEWTLGRTTHGENKNRRWLKAVLMARFEFVEWTPDKHLSHSRFVGLREEKNALRIRRER